MNAGVTVLLCVVALLGAGVAVAAGTNETIALPAAAICVGAGALLLVVVVERTHWPAGAPPRSVPADPARVRTSLRSGAFGRAELVSLLDRLDRAGGSPNLPSSSVEELERLQALSPEEFRDYLGARVGDLERRT
jgi:hypothetical protein